MTGNRKMRGGTSLAEVLSRKWSSRPSPVNIIPAWLCSALHRCIAGLYWSGCPNALSPPFPTASSRYPCLNPNSRWEHLQLTTFAHDRKRLHLPSLCPSHGCAHLCSSRHRINIARGDRNLFQTLGWAGTHHARWLGRASPVFHRCASVVCLFAIVMVIFCCVVRGLTGKW